MKNTKVQKMVAISLFAAMGLVLQFFGFPVIPAFGFMKVDFSDIPVLLSMFLYGPLAGIFSTSSFDDRGSQSNEYRWRCS